MADLADDADKLIEQQMADRIAAAGRAGPVIAPRGYCLNCGARELPDGSPWPEAYRWCDPDCKADWTRATGVR
jgi:hypothetical protein